MDQRVAAGLPRRDFLGLATAGLCSAAFSAAHRDVLAFDPDAFLAPWIAAPPAAFRPLKLPGRVAKVTKAGDLRALMQPNELWPKSEIANRFLESVMVALTGETSLVSSLRHFVHPEDRVALKINGISGQTGATVAFNAELVLPLVRGLLELGVAAQHITVFEQFPNFLAGTRVNRPGLELPEGVIASAHANRDVRMPEVAAFNRTKTRFVRQVTDATAIIDLTMMKDHSICGFTGALKNMTHGQIVNPEKHHAHRCDPQIPVLYVHPVLQSRVRLHIVDAFKVIFDKGPLDKDPACRTLHGSVYAATDPVALDTIGTQVISSIRRERGLPTWESVGRAPTYVQTAAELGLGLTRDADITLKAVTL